MISILENVPLPESDSGIILENAVKAVLQVEKPGVEVDLSVVIDNDESVRDLNRQFRNIDAPTDVLSFEANDVNPGTGILYLGDIVISIDQAGLQAKNLNHSLMEELQLLVIHGTLHLLGYDHAKETEKEKMWNLQRLFLSSLGVNLSSWPEE